MYEEDMVPNSLWKVLIWPKRILTVHRCRTDGQLVDTTSCRESLPRWNMCTSGVVVNFYLGECLKPHPFLLFFSPCFILFLSLPFNPIHCPFPILFLSPPFPLFFPLSLSSFSYLPFPPILRSRPPSLLPGDLGERLSSPSRSGHSPTDKLILVHYRHKFASFWQLNDGQFPVFIVH